MVIVWNGQYWQVFLYLWTTSLGNKNLECA